MMAVASAAIGGVLGGGFFLWIAGTRVINPNEFAWLMKLDWRINFLGWHLFRNEPWRIPPGALEGYLAGEGTSIGLTDSVPLAALVLKPFDALLPTPFQYFGLWLLLCYVLQGVFGALITRVWTRNLLLQALGAAMFVLGPTLLIRVGHPALTAHFLLLWPLWLYLRSDASPGAHLAHAAAAGLCAGLTHPYIAAMTMTLIFAIVVRDRTRTACAVFAFASTMTAFGWWLGGLFAISGASDFSAGGLGLYSMNLLAPITPHGWSTLLPEQPIAHQMQSYEGFQYLGAGHLLLLLLLPLILVWRGRIPLRRSVPLLAVCGACALYALSPRVTVASAVLVDVSSPIIDRLAFFRASGRFFWPMTYLLLAGSIAIVVQRLRTPLAIAVLITAPALQMADQRRAHAERRATSRSDVFHSWPRQLRSPIWSAALPYYQRIDLVPASQCPGATLQHEELAYLAGTHGLSINAGLAARWSEARRRRYCGAQTTDLVSGAISPDTFFVLEARHADLLKQSARIPISCGVIDAVTVCVATSSYERWRHAAPMALSP